MKETRTPDSRIVEVYSRYSGRELLKMGRKLFCDLLPGQDTSVSMFWDHLLMLKQGRLLLTSLVQCQLDETNLKKRSQARIHRDTCYGAEWGPPSVLYSFKLRICYLLFGVKA